MRVKAKPRYKNAAGDLIPGTTTPLAILAKPALVNWANRLGLQGIDSTKYKDALADIGTLAHYLVMCRLTDELPEVDEFTPEQVKSAQVCYQKYTDWESRNPITPILTETPLVSEVYQYGGQVDLYGVSNDMYLLVDFKTGKGLFPESTYQVAAYRQLLIENGFPVDKVVILRIGRNELEGVEEKIVSTYELDIGFQVFSRCLELHNLITKGRI